jgi:acetyl esterase/lipase
MNVGAKSWHTRRVALDPQAAELCERIARSGGGRFAGRTVAEIRHSGLDPSQMWSLEEDVLAALTTLIHSANALSDLELAAAKGWTQDHADEVLTDLLHGGFARFRTLADGTKVWQASLSGHRHPHTGMSDVLKRLEEELPHTESAVAGPDHEVSAGVSLRLYRPEHVGPVPVAMFIHGGAFVSGSVQMYDAFCHAIAEMSGVAIASVEYRLIPEHPFPTQLEDCLAALQWLLKHGPELDLSTDRVAIMGDSAGGSLAAATVMQAHASRAGTVSSLVLLYPVLDATMSAPSILANVDAPLFSAACVQWMYNTLDAPPDDWRASPLQSPHLKLCPPTFVVTAECDPVRDDGARFVARLAELGVDARHENCAGMMHGFAMFSPLLPEATRARKLIANELRSRLSMS